MATPTEVTTPTDHRPELVTVIAHMRAKQGKEQDLRDALEALIPPTSREEGTSTTTSTRASRIRACSISTRTGRPWIPTRPTCTRRIWTISPAGLMICSTAA